MHLSDTMSGGVRTLQVQVTSPRHAEDVIVQVEAQGEIVAATLDGNPFDLSVLSKSAHHHLSFTYFALPDKGFESNKQICSAAKRTKSSRDFYTEPTHTTTYRSYSWYTGYDRNCPTEFPGATEITIRRRTSPWLSDRGGVLQ